MFIEFTKLCMKILFSKWLSLFQDNESMFCSINRRGSYSKILYRTLMTLTTSWILLYIYCEFMRWIQPDFYRLATVYPKKYAHGFCFAVLCCCYTFTDFPISIRLTSLALWQSNDCTSASNATLMNMDKCFMWIHYERLHNHNKAKHNKTVCIFLGIYCTQTQLGMNCADMRIWLTAMQRRFELLPIPNDFTIITTKLFMYDEWQWKLQWWQYDGNISN